jgi:predicted Zn-dependent protease
MEQSRANEAAADHYAVRLLARAGEIPMGAILFFEA